jgi:phosphoribosylformimino-5-aminoimidazole carboxamide ribotide isomerase
MELLPAIDLRGGQAVRLEQGDFARERPFGDPLGVADQFAAAGTRWLHVVDLDAARDRGAVNRPLVLAIARRTGLAVQTGGGVRSEQDVADLIGGGIARVVLGTAALEDRALLVRCAERFPGQVALGLDYRSRPDGVREAAVRGWTQGSGRAVGEVLDDVASVPLAAVVATAIERDGTLRGPDLSGLGALLDATALPVVASGGVATASDLRALAGLRSARHARPLAGVVVGRALLDGSLSIEEAIAACATSG